MSATDNADSLETTLATAERILTDALGGSVQLNVGADIPESGRTWIVRCDVIDGPAGAPASVIIKRAQTDESHPYDPDDGTDWSPASRLFNDWAGTHFLTEIGGDPPHSPRLYGGDRAQGIIVMEDLGNGASLANALLGDDPAPAEAGLLALAAGLGRMHAATIGRTEEYRRIRRALGPQEADETATVAEYMAKHPHWDEAACAQIGFSTPPGFEAEMRQVAATFSDPGPFLAYTHGDPCPDNNRYEAGRLRLFDFETGGCRHALIDGVYGRLPFPTCWCVNRLPDPLPARMEAVYRAELARGCPQANDDALFGRAVTEICASWCLRTTNGSLVRALEADDRWGIATIRQRILLRLDLFAATTEEFGHLPVMGASARQLAERLRSLWPAEADQIPLYPAFRVKGEELI